MEKDQKTLKNSRELRVIIDKVTVEQRGEGDQKKSVIVGYAAKFGKRSVPMMDWCGSYVEEIAPGAFDGCLNDDVRCLFNHDESSLLGRTLSKTCRLSIDSVGLRYECDPPMTATADEVLALIARGDVSGSSFQFTVDTDSWRVVDGFDVRTIQKVAKLYDVSPCTFPAYHDTEVSVRSETREAFAKNKDPKSADNNNKMKTLELLSKI